jgi:hypothetical protein
MNLFWVIAGNVRALRRFESLRKFKALPRRAKSTVRFHDRQVDFAGTCAESFPLRETGQDVSLTTFAASTVLETSAV